MAVYSTRDKSGKVRWRYRRQLILPDGTTARISGCAPKLKNTKPAAEGEELAHVARVLNPTAPAATRKEIPTFKEWSETYMEIVAVKQSPSEQDGKRQKLASLLVPELGRLRLDEITEIEIDRLRVKLSGKKQATVNNYLATVGAILRYGAKKYRYDLPDLGLVKVNAEDQPFEVYSDAELAQLLEQARGDVMMTCAILLGADAGLRAGEIRALRRVNVRVSEISVEWSDYNGLEKKPKSGRARRVPILTPRLAAALHAATHQHLGPRVLARRDGLPWSKESMTHAAPPKGWHALRHSFCTRLAQQGVSPRKIQKWAGHASLKTTERYTHDDGAIDGAELATARAALMGQAESKNAPTVAPVEASNAKTLANV